ncbi:hypothetical protein [Nocardia sp. NBC_01327]|uniref:hypothetical protein n=1 Tax=Nocardia sp. NBC_01327 TaxID=2903593 RepID=UPI002E140939|nr:hypothetical protein OG326_42515 [Nocardia sp. NBC_01327]
MKRTLVLVFALAVLVLLGGALITTTRHHPAQHASTPGGDGDYNLTDPTPHGAGPAVAAQQALMTMFSWQPSRDGSAGAGLARAKPWLSGQLAASAEMPPATGIKPLTEWAQWRQGADVVTATATTTAISAPDIGRCVVKVALTQMVLHRDGSSNRWRVMDIDARTTDSPDGWRLEGFTVTDSH